MLFHTLINHSGEIRFSPIPEVDKQFADLAVLQTKFPLGFLAFALKDMLQERGSIKRNTGQDDIKARILITLQKAVIEDEIKIAEPFRWDSTCRPRHSQMNTLSAEKQHVLKNEQLFSLFLTMVKGRQLAEGEFGFLAKSLNIRAESLLVLMQKAVLSGQGHWIPALRRSRKNWSCTRCGNLNCRVWPSAYGEAATCEACKSIGSLNTLQVIFRYIEADQNKQNTLSTRHIEKNMRLSKETSNNFNFRFSSAQQRAATQLLAYCEAEENSEVLIWAACGAGKTEVSFPLIYRYLEQGKNVLFAAPRQDVVHDVYPRLQNNFPNQKVKVMSGAVSADWKPCSLTVATTHQILKFYRCFDLIIFDETDAYPYAGNKNLEFGLKQAIKETGSLIYLTATPSEELLRKIACKQCSLVRLPIRHHGYPVPVPEFIRLKQLEKRIQLHQIQKDSHFKSLLMTLQELKDSGPLLVFVPAISMVSTWKDILRCIFPMNRVEGSWSSDPQRRRKVSDFIEEKCDILVCTSILERGVTVDNVQVAVLCADHELYDIRSLVQMAGRIGRTSAHPTGRAVFLASKQTKAISGAIAWIKEQNGLAQQEGFVDG